MGERAGRPGWNHNIHCALAVLDRLSVGTTRALDVGCGEGWLTRELSPVVELVIGLDPDGTSLGHAREQDRSGAVGYVRADLLAHPFRPGVFDLVTCICALHHTDEATGLRRLGDLVRPGGLVFVVGVARSRTPLDLAWDAVGTVATRIFRLRRTWWETPAPRVWPPPHTYRQLRRITAAVLPGSHFRRRALFRYELTWTRPFPAVTGTAVASA